MNTTTTIREQFYRLGWADTDFEVHQSKTPGTVVICDTQSCGLYDAEKALAILTDIDENDDDAPWLWDHLSSALIEDDVHDKYDSRSDE